MSQQKACLESREQNNTQMHLAYTLCIGILLCSQLVVVTAESSTVREFSARELDSLLQDYAFKVFAHRRRRTGVIYEGNVPGNLTGISVSAMRLRSGSFRRRGFVDYKEFRIPVGVVEQPYVQRLVLVYHNLGNWSSLYYPLPGYTFLTPVLGLLAYDASDLSATSLSELDIRASLNPISIKFSHVKPLADGGGSSPSAMCACFGLDGSVQFDNVGEGNTCLSSNQGHFAIVKALPAAPAPTPAGKGGGGGVGRGGKKKKSRAWIVVVGSVVGGSLLLVFLGLVVVCVMRCREAKRMRKMEEAAEWDVPLPMARVGHTKAPVALETRTRPLLENEFVP